MTPSNFYLVNSERGLCLGLINSAGLPTTEYSGGDWSVDVGSAAFEVWVHEHVKSRQPEEEADPTDLPKHVISIARQYRLNELRTAQDLQSASGRPWIVLLEQHEAECINCDNRAYVFGTRMTLGEYIQKMFADLERATFHATTLERDLQSQFQVVKKLEQELIDRCVKVHDDKGVTCYEAQQASGEVTYFRRVALYPEFRRVYGSIGWSRVTPEAICYFTPSELRALAACIEGS